MYDKLYSDYISFMKVLDYHTKLIEDFCTKHRFSFDHDEVQRMVIELIYAKKIKKLDYGLLEIIGAMDVTGVNVPGMIGFLLIPHILYKNDPVSFYRANNESKGQLSCGYKNDLEKSLINLDKRIGVNNQLVKEFADSLSINDKAHYGLFINEAVLATVAYCVYSTKDFDKEKLMSYLHYIFDNQVTLSEYLNNNGIISIYCGDKDNRYRYYKCLEKYYERYLSDNKIEIR